MQDEIRHWFISHKELTGKFPSYPLERDGGSSKIFAAKNENGNNTNRNGNPNPNASLTNTGGGGNGANNAVCSIERVIILHFRSLQSVIISISDIGICISLLSVIYLPTY